MALNPVNPIQSGSATATNGSPTITVTGGVDCSFIVPGFILQIGTRRIVTAISGTAPVSGVSTITLATNWDQPTTTDVLIGWNSYESLPNIVNRIQNALGQQTAIGELATNGLIEKTGTNAYQTVTVTAFAKTLLDDADAAAARTTLGAQAADATLTAMAGVTTAANKIIYFTGADAAAAADLSAYGRTLIATADAAAARTALSVQPLDATLTAVAGVTTAANKIIYFTGVDVAASADLSAFGRSVIAAADAAAVNTLLGISISHIKSLPAAANAQSNTVYNVISFYDGWAAMADSPAGGGRMVWNPSLSKSNHTGGTIIAPESITAWAGTQADIATLLNWTGSGTGCWVRVFDGNHTPEMFGAVGSGTPDDTAALTKSIVVGDTQLTPLARYRITSRVTVPNGRRVSGDRTSVVEMDGASFNGSTSYASNSIGFLLDGNTSGGLCGFHVKLINQTDELIAGAAAVRSCSNVYIKNMEVSGFRKSKVVAVDSSADCFIDGNYIHDCLLASITTGQLTGIDIDNNRVGGVASTRISACDNVIENLTCSPAFNTSFGYQTDGINVSHASSNRHTIERNTLRNVGEGIDCFGSRCSISNNMIFDAYSFGIKIIHGASRNAVKDNKIFAAGYAGISLTGIGSAPTDTEYNEIAGNFICDVNLAGNWSSQATAGIRVDSDGGAKFTKRNIIRDNTIANGSAMKWGILLDSGSQNNEVEENKIESFILGEFTNNGSGNVILSWSRSVPISWTPVFQGASTAGSCTYSEQVGRYTRVGNSVTVWGRLEISAINTAMVGDLEISGLPFNTPAGGMIYSISIAQYNKIDMSTGYTQVTGRLVGNSGRITIMQNGDNAAPAPINSALAAVGTSIIFSCTYLAA